MNNIKKKIYQAILGETVPIASAVVAATATVGGDKTGLIAAGSRLVVGTGVNGQTGYLVTLPAITANTMPIIIANNSGYAFKIKSDTPASVSINGATGNVALSLATAKIAVCTPVSVTAWMIMIADAAAAS